MRDGDPDAHRFLSVAVPLALAEAHAFLGEPEPARAAVAEASGAIIGSPFLELDWRIELLRARLALKAGDTRGARAHLHRAAHSRDLLQRLVPPRAQARFLAHSRFRWKQSYFYGRLKEVGIDIHRLREEHSRGREAPE